MTTGNKIMWKRGEIAPKEQFLLFSTLFYIYIFLTSGVKWHIHLLNVVVKFIVFLNLWTLICRSTDILIFWTLFSFVTSAKALIRLHLCQLFTCCDSVIRCICDFILFIYQIAVIVGGLSMQKQRRILKRCPDIIVATPGRLWELVQEV